MWRGILKSFWFSGRTKQGHGQNAKTQVTILGKKKKKTGLAKSGYMNDEIQCCDNLMCPVWEAERRIKQVRRRRRRRRYPLPRDSYSPCSSDHKKKGATHLHIYAGPNKWSLPCQKKIKWSLRTSLGPVNVTAPKGPTQPKLDREAQHTRSVVSKSDPNCTANFLVMNLIGNLIR